MSILFNCIEANTINTNSQVSIGSNKQSDRQSNLKTNSGNGKVKGKNETLILGIYIFDNDIIDNPVYSPSTIKPGKNKLDSTS